MFPLKERKIGGFKFGQKYPASFGSLAGHPHLGVDYHAVVGTPLYAPYNGTIKSLYGTQGGNTIWFYPDGQDVIIRFMHLSEYKISSGKVKEGNVIALTGNTGSVSNSPHLHLDISKHSVNINNIDNFIDPEKFDWYPQKSPVPIKEPETTSMPVKPVETPTESKIEVTDTTQLPVSGDKLDYQTLQENQTKEAVDSLWNLIKLIWKKIWKN